MPEPFAGTRRTSRTSSARDSDTRSGPLRAQPELTTRRLHRLRAYMTKEVLAPEGFCCSNEGQCSASIRAGDRFYKGTLSHVGKHYDLSLGGRPLRVVVVGQEDGLYSPVGDRKREGVSLEERYHRIHDLSGLQYRYYADGTHPARSPHMRGTTSALRILFGKGEGFDWEGEFIEAADGERFHVFDAFALVNLLLCSAGPPSSSRGRSTSTMRLKCLRHFTKTLEILEPTILILQGMRVQRSIAPLMTQPKKVSPYLTDAVVEGGRMLVCHFSHPSARGEQRWGDRLNAGYLCNVVKPTLLEAAAEIRKTKR